MPGGCPSYPFCSFKRGPWYPVFRENPSREVATKDHSSSNPPKRNPLDLKTKVDVNKVDVNKVDVKGFPTQEIWWPVSDECDSGDASLANCRPVGTANNNPCMEEMSSSSQAKKTEAVKNAIPIACYWEQGGRDSLSFASQRCCSC